MNLITKISKITNIIKTISSLVLFTFLTSISSSFVYAMPMANINIPLDARFGKIVDTFQGNSLEKIILIQDIHCQKEVQENIYKILSSLKNKYKNDFNTIGLEGTPLSKVNTDIISKIKDGKIKKAILKYLLYSKESFLDQNITIY